MNENIRKKRYITMHPTILRKFIAGKGIRSPKQHIWEIGIDVLSVHDDCNRVSQFKDILTVECLKISPYSCAWLLTFLYAYEDVMKYFLENNKNNMSVRDWSYDKFTWSDEIYERELARDIRSRRNRIAGLFRGAAHPCGPIVATISRYIDYI